MAVIELKNPQALLVPDVANLIRRATESVGFCAPGGFDSIAEDIFKFVTSPNFFFILGGEKGSFHSLIFGHYPSDNVFPYPTILLVYNEGSNALRRETVRFLMDLLLSRGYTKAWAVNGSKRSDSAWMRLFDTDGVTARPIGTVMEFGIE